MIQCAIPRAGRDAMSDPYGAYTFVGLGFTGLLFLPISDGYLSYGEDSRVRLNSATYDDTDGVTFSASESPVGAFNLKFVGSLIFDMSGNVTGMAGTWTGTISRTCVSLWTLIAPSSR
jgi:hypothetical protein